MTDASTTSPARSRPKIPFWAMAALALLPLWAYMYVRSTTATTASAEGPMFVGAQVYNGCATCHGPNGEGGVGRPLSGGAVLATFAHIEDHLRFVSYGTEAYVAAGVDIYGDPARPGGAHRSGSFGVMPAQSAAEGGSLTDAEILAVVCHERFELGGADRAAEPFLTEFDVWCATSSPAFRALETGTALSDLDEAGLVDAAGEPIQLHDIGDGPAEGAPAG